MKITIAHIWLKVLESREVDENECNKLLREERKDNTGWHIMQAPEMKDIYKAAGIIQDQVRMFIMGRLPDERKKKNE